MEWWVVPSWAIGVVGLGYAYLTDRHHRREVLHRQQRFEWVHVHQGVRQTCRAVLKSGFHPEALVAVPGAGLILTELAVVELGEWLPVVTLQQKDRHDEAPFPFDGGREVTTAKWRYYIPSDLLSLRGKRLLIFDDYAQSGDTLTSIREALIDEGFEPGNLRTAALITVKGLREAAKAPDFTWFWVDTFDVHMPWGHASKRIRAGLVDAA